MHLLKRSIYAAILIFVFTGCNGDGWLSRQWHNTNARYNIYFNAEQAWNTTYNAMRDGYKDDYRTFIELYNVGDQATLKGNQGAMDEVVKKASTLLDKHPKSHWVDDAYLLMGKAYFLKGDFFAATDIFEFVNTSFKDPVIRYKSRLWIFQCLYFQGKISECQSLLRALKEDKEFPQKLQSDLNKAIAALYLKTNQPSKAIEPLTLALEHAKGKMEKYRLHFALGQALLSTEQYDKAEAQYAKVVKMNPPYEMAFNARINQVEILSLQKKDYAKANVLLKRMLRDDKNIEYYAQIYYRMGKNELRAGNVTKGIDLLNKSLQNSESDRAQATTTYITLGDLYYGAKNYEKAGLYYDSANMNLDEKHPDYDVIAKKGLLLTELLRHLITIKKQDSLLRLAGDPALLEKTIDRLIENEKKAAQNPGTNAGSPPKGPGPSPIPGTGGAVASSFPFYNTDSRQRGREEFEKLWGQRTNRDYWRLNARKSGNGNDAEDPGDNAGGDTAKNQIPNASESRKKYYAEIPYTAEAKKLANEKIESSLFGAAQVYQNSLSEPASATFYYKELLRRYPDSKYRPQALYEIAKMAKTAGNTKEYQEYRNLLETRYPESIYLKLLDDPNAAKKELEKSPAYAKKEIQDLYERMYANYKNEKFDTAISVKRDADRRFAGNILQPKFDYLEALCFIRKGDLKTGISGLDQVVTDYPDSEEAKEAGSIIEAHKRRTNPVVVAPDTSKAVSGALWKEWDKKEELYFLITYPRGGNSNLLRAGIGDYNKENYIFEKLQVSSVQVVGETVFFTVSDFSTPDICREYTALLFEKADFFASRGLFEYDLAWISKTNYQTLLNSKRINGYIDYFKTLK